MAARASCKVLSATSSRLGHKSGMPTPSGDVPAGRLVWGMRSWHRAWQTQAEPRLPGPRLGSARRASASAWERCGCGGRGQFLRA